MEQQLTSCWKIVKKITKRLQTKKSKQALKKYTTNIKKSVKPDQCINDVIRKIPLNKF